MASLVFRLLTLPCGVGVLFATAIAIALRPYGPVVFPWHLPEPELWLCAAGGIVAAAVCAWRVWRGSSASDELEKLNEAALKGDHLG
jgi:hypothetical protein